MIFKDGLVRLASEPYERSTGDAEKDQYKHLTNYSLNKKNKNFDGNIHKRRISNWLRGTITQGDISKKADKIWEDIEEIVVKTLIISQPQVSHIYRSCQQKEPENCFELLGFDIMLDSKLKCWLLEVNHTPSFGADTGCDYDVKYELIKSTLTLLGVAVNSRKIIYQKMKEESKKIIPQ